MRLKTPKITKKKQDSQDNRWRGAEFISKETNNEWLQQSMVGQVREPEKVLEVQEALFVEGLSSVYGRQYVAHIWCGWISDERVCRGKQRIAEKPV